MIEDPVERELEAYEEYVFEYDVAMGNIPTEPEYGESGKKSYEPDPKPIKAPKKGAKKK